MQVGEQKELSRRALDAWGSGSSVDVSQLFTDDYINHQEPDVSGGVSDKTLVDWERLVTEFHGAFSNVEARPLMQVAEGDLVATRWQITATHTGEYMGAQPTGKVVSWTGVQLDRYQGGKIAESWVDWDKYGLFAALGLVP